MSRLSQSVSIMQTGNNWHVACDNIGRTPETGLTADALAGKLFLSRPEIDVVMVVDGKGKTIRAIHRNLFSLDGEHGRFTA